MTAEIPENGTREPDALDSRRRRAIYRARHRGTKEMDLLLGRFADARLPGMSDVELKQFEELLALPDPELQRWLLAPVAAPAAAGGPEAHALGALVADLRRFHGLLLDI